MGLNQPLINHDWPSLIGMQRDLMEIETMDLYSTNIN